MPKTKWILALLSCLLLAGGAFYWRNEGQRAPAEIGRSAVTQAALPEEALQNPPRENETKEAFIEQTLLAAADRTAPTGAPEESSSEAPEWVFATEPLMVNINTATGAELQKLPGIGPGKAQAILDYRRENGPFQSIEELMLVPGIKEGTFSRLRDYVTV